jgi:C-terminal processing protease CtpA/Prc
MASDASPSTTPRPIESGALPSGEPAPPSPEKVWVDLGPVQANKHGLSPVRAPHSRGPHPGDAPKQSSLAAAGIGLHFAMRPGRDGRLHLVVAHVVPGGAAASSVVEAGDEVIEVNGRSCATWTVGEVWEGVSGPPNSIVGLMILKEATGQRVSTQLIRR